MSSEPASVTGFPVSTVSARASRSLSRSISRAKARSTRDQARRGRREIAPLHKTFGEFSLEDGYRIQRAGIGLRVERGETVAGYKMGLTSKAKRDQMNLAMPIYGVLTGAMRIPDSQAF